MRTMRPAIILLLTLTMITPPGLLPRAAGVDWFDSFKVRKPEFVPDENMDRLTREIDWLERQIETYGSVVPKQPDIWGEARLTRHRHEYDVQMSDELDDFSNTLNASIRQSDQAITQLAIALGAGEGADPLAEQNVFTILPQGEVFEKDTTGDGLGFAEKDGISIEPVTKLSQKSRYLYYLNELRRTNEGDDTTDSPGYSLYLARIPVSVLPGKHTRRGYGAEITFTAEPYLSEALLPEVFRVWVINDILNQSALSILKVIENPEARSAAEFFAKPPATNRKVFDFESNYDKNWRGADGDRPNTNDEAEKSYRAAAKENRKELEDALRQAVSMNESTSNWKAMRTAFPSGLAD